MRSYGRMAAIASSLVSMLPMILYKKEFQALFWFHDDWDLLSGFSELGLRKWLALPFAENFVPLFKISWIGSVLLSHGSYFFMICALWVTHWINLILFGWLLERARLNYWEISFSVITLGLAWSNIETLGWSPQWSQLLSLTFFLVSFHLLLGIIQNRVFRPLTSASYVLCIAGSALCFSRGVLSGIVLCICILVAGKEFALPRLKTVLLSLFSLAPPIVLLAAYYAPLVAVHPNMLGDSMAKLSAMAAFCLYYVVLNPLRLLIPVSHHGQDELVLMVYGMLKILIIGIAWKRRPAGSGAILTTLIALDILNGVLLGMGRYGTGLPMATSSRYQYVSLLCLAPFLALSLEGLPHLAGGKRFFQKGLLAVVIIGWSILGLAYPWSYRIGYWARWRGLDVRQALLDDRAEDQFAPASISTRRARELAARFNLH